MTGSSHKPASATASTGAASTPSFRIKDAAPPEPNRDGLQGEGNTGAARAFNAAESGFVAAGKVAEAARAAAPKSEAERLAMIAAEEEGRRRSKGEDPGQSSAPSGPVPFKAGKAAGRKHP